MHAIQQAVQSGCSAIYDIAKDALEFLSDLIEKVVSAVSSFFEGLFFGSEEATSVTSLEGALQRGIDPPISQMMLASDFIALCRNYPIRVKIKDQNDITLREQDVQTSEEGQALFNEVKNQIRQQRGGEERASHLQYEARFPVERIQIGGWAGNWARVKTLQIDPQSPYFEIFQEAFRLKNQIDGGTEASEDYRDYSLNHRLYLNDSLFCYIIFSLLGFQELSRTENRELIKYLDNRQSTYAENPAYQFTTSLSKIFSYPTGNHDRDDTPMDIQDKLQIGIPAPMEAFRAAQQNGKVLEYFQRAFDHRNCFDHRVSMFQRFQLEATHPHLEDFTPNIVRANTTREKVFEYYRIFRNRQIFQKCQESGGDYDTLKNRINIGEDTLETQQFYQNYCTKDRFEAYLLEENSPIREKRTLPLNFVQPPEIPMQADWDNNVPQGFKRVPLDQIPADQRQIGAILGVKDPSFYVATIDLRGYSWENTCRCYLQFSRDKVRPWQVCPEFDYPHLWNGLEKVLIDVNRLPVQCRYPAARVKIKDPATYRVKIHSINEPQGFAEIDCRGEPITRAQWEAFLIYTEYESYWRP